MSPVAKGWRTFLQVLAGGAATWLTIDWVSDWRNGATIFGLQAITAVIAGLAAFFMAFKFSATTPLHKAIFTFTQAVGGGLATLGLNELTSTALVNLGSAFGRLAITAAVAAVVTYVTNVAEAQPAAQPKS